MIVAIGLALFSLLLIYLEFFVPTAVFGVLGGIGFCLAILLFCYASEHIWQMIIFIILMIAFLILTIKGALWKFKQKPAMFAQEAQSGYVASEFDKELIGKAGHALTDLKPSGYIIIEGDKHHAVSESRYIKKGESVKIIGGEGTRLIVRKQ